MGGRGIARWLVVLGTVLVGATVACRRGQRQPLPSAHDYFMAARAAAARKPPPSAAEVDFQRRIEQIGMDGPFWGGPTEVSCVRSVPMGLDERGRAGLTPREAMKKLAVERQQLRLTPEVPKTQRGPDAFLADLGLGVPADAYDAIFRFVPSGAPATRCGEWSEKGLQHGYGLAIPGTLTVELWRGLVLRVAGALSVSFDGRPGALQPHASLNAETQARGHTIWIRWEIDDAARATADLIIPPRGKPDRTKLEDHSRWRTAFYWSLGWYKK